MQKNQTEQKKISPFALWILRVAGILFFLPFLFFYNTPELSKPPKTDINSKALVKTAFSFLKDEELTLKGEENDRVNILFLGLPGKGNSAPDLTDSIILASIKPSTNQLALLSIPRDLLVYIKKEKRYAKINSLFAENERNPELLTEKIKEMTGQDVYYYVALDITAVQKIVDALGGINVFVKKDIYDPQFPTPGFGTEVFEVKKGWRYFDGETVQKYLRTRYSPNGDFDRIEQQQAVIEALRKKIFGLNLLVDFPTLISIYKATKDNIQTNIAENEIKSFFEVLRNISYDNVISKSLDAGKKDSLLIADTFMFGSQRGFVLKPKAGDFDYSEIKTLAENIFDLK